jgi:hypothetical protein
MVFAVSSPPARPKPLGGVMHRRFFLLFVFLLVGAAMSIAGPASSQEVVGHEVEQSGLEADAASPARAFSQKLVTLRDWMSGSFSSAAQAADDPEFFYDIRLHMTPMWADREDAFWLYVEQAVADHQDKPYRQRVYRLTQLADDLFESTVFTFEDPLSQAGAWRSERPLAELTPDDLNPREGCSILLRWTGSAFAGSTLGRLCKSSLRGATYATSEVEITSSRVVSWDRGFDDDGRHVWGAEKGGYVFVKQQD